MKWIFSKNLHPLWNFQFSFILSFQFLPFEAIEKDIFPCRLYKYSSQNFAQNIKPVRTETDVNI